MLSLYSRARETRPLAKDSAPPEELLSPPMTKFFASPPGQWMVVPPAGLESTSTPLR